VATSSGRSIRLALAQDRPALILLDVLMPPLNGFDVCEALRRNNRTRTKPTVFLSNLDFEENVKMSLALGASDYLVNPVAAPGSWA